MSWFAGYPEWVGNNEPPAPPDATEATLSDFAGESTAVVLGNVPELLALARLVERAGVRPDEWPGVERIVSQLVGPARLEPYSPVRVAPLPERAVPALRDPDNRARYLAVLRRFAQEAP